MKKCEEGKDKDKERERESGAGRGPGEIVTKQLVVGRVYVPLVEYLLSTEDARLPTLYKPEHGGT